MHIHYNTKQTTLPLELACILPQDNNVFTIEKVPNSGFQHTPFLFQNYS